MFDAKQLLDVLMGATPQSGQTRDRQKDGLGSQVAETMERMTGQSPDHLLQKAKDVLANNPGLAQAAAIGLAGLLFGARKPGGGTLGNFAKMGGLALIGSLAYKAWQSRSAPSHNNGVRDSFQALDIPQGSPFDPSTQSQDDAALYLKAMIAAAAADGAVDAAERSRIAAGLEEAGVDTQATQWIAQEMASPASIQQLADAARSPEAAAQVYSAARIAIDADSSSEHEFLSNLAIALNLDPDLKAQIDGAANTLRAPRPA